MKSPEYKSDNYDAASKKYEELANLYSGKSGSELASLQATKTSVQQGNAASRTSAAAARSAGLGKMQAALLGANAAENAVNQGYASNYSNELSNNQKAVDYQKDLLSYAKSLDDAKYKREQAEYQKNMGVWKGILNTAGSTLSGAVTGFFAGGVPGAIAGGLTGLGTGTVSAVTGNKENENVLAQADTNAKNAQEWWNNKQANKVKRSEVNT